MGRGGHPARQQHLLCRASWNADAVRDDVREYVVEHLHDEAAVLIVDETGDVKKGYVLAVACSAEVPTGAGTFRADALVKKVPKRAWQKLSAGRGAKGQRFYDWAVIDLADPSPGRHQLLIRRNRTTGELAYYPCHSTTPASLATLVKVAGSRWRVEETFQSEKGWPGWTSTRSAATPPGPAGSPSRCWPMPSSQSSAPTNTHTNPHRTT